jgi:LemA protein
MDNKIILGVIGAVVLVIIIIGLMYIGMFNGLVLGEQTVNEKWSQVEVQYQRRVDLIPNVISTVKGEANFEQETLTQLSELRSRWQTSTNVNDKVETANQIESTLSKILVMAENYPTLQATQGYQTLIVELEGTENRIAFARGEFNTAVKNYNTAVMSIPSNIVASMNGFSVKEFFEAAEGADNVPVVDFE